MEALADATAAAAAAADAADEAAADAATGDDGHTDTETATMTAAHHLLTRRAIVSSLGAHRQSAWGETCGRLPEEEQLLLQSPLMLDKGDIYPARAEPHFLVEPPAPALGHITTSYVEVAGKNGHFRCAPALTANDCSDAAGARTCSATPGSSHDGGAKVSRFSPLVYGPTGGMQALMLCVGVALHLSHGALAGASLLQLALHPWPDSNDTLVQPMAFACVAMRAQRTMRLLATFAFLDACDLHAATKTYTTGLILWLHVTVVITLLIEMPTDVSLALGRNDRESVLAEALDYSLGINRSLFDSADGSIGLAQSAEILGAQPYRGGFVPNQLASMQYEEQKRDFFSTSLSKQQLDFWAGLMWGRASLTLLCWVLITLLHSGWTFSLPPIAYESLRHPS